ncbi:MAG: Spore gernimation protein GerPF [Bacilli bacterium]|nr:Spore gernimation protein GerPF [Bacilli bacterium]
MPAIIGVNVINQIASVGNAIFGDIPFIIPKTATKTFSGAGSGNNSVVAFTSQIFSINNSLDTDVNDENVIAPGLGGLGTLFPIGGLPFKRGRVSPVALRGKRNVNGRLVSNKRNKHRVRG